MTYLLGENAALRHSGAMNNERPRLAVLFVLSLALAQPSPIVAQTFPDQPVDEVGWCRAFLTTFFPEFQQSQTNVKTLGHNYTFTMTALPSTDASGNDASAGRFAAISTFKFRNDKLLSEWTVTEVPRRLAEMRKTVESHPEWTEKRIREEMRAAGARFLPGDEDAFVQSISTPETRALFGDIRFRNVRFFYGVPSDPHPARLYWRAEIVVTRDGRAHHSYAFLADPFTGKPYIFDLYDSPSDLARQAQEQ